MDGYRFNAIGYLKASPDGTKLAIAHNTISNIPNRQSPGGLLIYDFDAATGIVTNEASLNIDNGNPYGVEFSPSNDILYASIDFIDGNTPPRPSIISQFDLTAADISASRFDIASNSSGALQLAPNGKIYHSNFGNTSLNAIDNPNGLGVNSNFIPNAQPLAGRISTFGLPPFIQSLFNETIDIINSDNSLSTDIALCEGNSFTFRVPLFSGATYSWFFDNGTTEIQLACNTEECALINAQQNSEGIYRVEIDRMDGSCPAEGFGFVSVNPLPIANNTRLIQCDVDEGDSTDGFALFNLTQAVAAVTENVNELVIEFFESLDDIANETPIDNFESYRNIDAFNQIILVRITNSNNCQNVAELELNVQPTVTSLPVIGPFFSCEVNPNDGVIEGSFNLDEIRINNYPATLDITFYRNLIDASLERNSISGDNFISESSTVFVRIENAYQCQSIEQFDLIVDPAPQFEFPEEITLCLNQLPLEVLGPLDFDLYNWFRINPDGTETLEFIDFDFEIFEIGEYRLEVGQIFNSFGVFRTCFNSRTFIVVPSNIATITDIEVRDILSNNTIRITVEGEGDYEYAINDINGPYQDSPLFENVPPGFSTVFIRDKNGCGIVQEIVSVIGVPNFFTPNGDSINDRWQLIGLSEQFQENSFIFIFDRFGKLLAQVDPSGLGWDGIFNGRPLPSSDYWFRIQLVDGRDFTGHFSLKR